MKTTLRNYWSSCVYISWINDIYIYIYRVYTIYTSTIHSGKKRKKNDKKLWYINPQYICSCYMYIFARRKSNDFHAKQFAIYNTHVNRRRHFISVLIISSNSFRLYAARSWYFMLFYFTNFRNVI